MGEVRPSPDALLAEARAERRGRLKVFLGAAPGVGKTYAMLVAAHRLKAQGVDVAVGVVETHGRAETAALLDGLDAVAPRRVEYEGRTLAELDLDAVLARRPQLVLVDELAHTNAPGSRHPKRHQDVADLLAAGIDVHATLNVQHLESLNDVVARITRVRVRETVPDSVLEQADEVEVIDLTPADLIRRLEEGKVYAPDQARHALRHWFRPGNLAALRELALRSTAARVDAQMRSYMRAHAIAGPWDAGERVLACVDESAAAAGVVRHAKRLADRLGGPFHALFVETPRHAGLDEAARARSAAALRLAQELGGTTQVVPGGDVAAEIVACAREQNFTLIVVGRSRRRWPRRGVADALRALAGDIPVLTVGGAAAAAPRPRAAAPRLSRDPRDYALTLALVALATAAGVGIEALVDLSNISLVFVAPVLAGAMWFGLGPALFAAAASTLAYNFFFIAPRYTFTIADPSNVVAAFFLLLVAVLASSLVARVREHGLIARREARTAAQLYAFSRNLTATNDLDDLLWASAFQIASLLRVEAVLLLPGEAGLEVRAGFPPEDRLEPAEIAAAAWAFDRGEPTGRGAATLPGTRRLFLPLKTARGTLGVVGLAREGGEPLLTPEAQRWLDAVMSQVALAVERAALAAEAGRARVLAEADRLKGALLASLSHDLRTPLAAILGALGTLAGRPDPDPARRALVADARDQAERLNRFVANLLDMTRIEAGALQPQAQPIDPADAVNGAIRRLGRALAQHQVSVDLPDTLPLLRADEVLLEQVFVNLLENAAKFAPAGSAIRVTAEVGPGLTLAVEDRGPGIAPAEAERVFDKFHRAGGHAGTGLGLAICRGFVGAMGGTIRAEPRAGGGARLAVAFPAALLVSAAPAP